MAQQLKQAKNAKIEKLPIHKRIALGAKLNGPVASPSVDKAKQKSK